MATKTTKKDDYAASFMAFKKKAQNLANAYGKPVGIYRKIVNNRPAEFVLSVQGASKSTKLMRTNVDGLERWEVRFDGESEIVTREVKLVNRVS